MPTLNFARHKEPTFSLSHLPVTCQLLAPVLADCHALFVFFRQQALLCTEFFFVFDRYAELCSVELKWSDLPSARFGHGVVRLK